MALFHQENVNNVRADSKFENHMLSVKWTLRRRRRGEGVVMDAKDYIAFLRFCVNVFNL